MNADVLLSTCKQAGVSVWIEGGALKAYGEEDSVKLLLPQLKEHKEALKAILTTEESAFYEERAAIAEYDGGLTRTDAECQAKQELEASCFQRRVH